MSRMSLVPLALLAVGCGGANNLCEKWADELEACDEDYSVEDCEEQLEPCSADDRQLLDEFYECASDEGLFACDAELEGTNLTDALENLGAVFACMEPLEDLSDECQGEMMTGSTGAVF